jgi:hypothetical protein
MSAPSSSYIRLRLYLIKRTTFLFDVTPNSLVSARGRKLTIPRRVIRYFHVFPTANFTHYRAIDLDVELKYATKRKIKSYVPGKTVRGKTRGSLQAA